MCGNSGIGDDGIRALRDAILYHNSPLTRLVLGFAANGDSEEARITRRSGVLGQGHLTFNAGDVHGWKVVDVNANMLLTVTRSVDRSTYSS